jgi:uncharacterized protein (TIGR00645 family)
MKKLAHFLEVFIFTSRWLLAPLYIGLVGALVLLLWRYAKDFITLAQHIDDADSHHFTIDLLSLLDAVLLGNLVVMVLFAGYENFVSKIEVAEDTVDRPTWMGTVGFSGLKLRLIGSLVAISVIELLKDFIELSNNPQEDVGQGTIWRIVIHLTFVVSGVLFAIMDRIGENADTEKPIFSKTHGN